MKIRPVRLRSRRFLAKRQRSGHYGICELDSAPGGCPDPVAERQAESMRSMRFSGLKAANPIHILRAASFTGFGGSDASVTTTRLPAVRG
jgi:hypothetical protein